MIWIIESSQSLFSSSNGGTYLSGLNHQNTFRISQSETPKARPIELTDPARLCPWVCSATTGHLVSSFVGPSGRLWHLWNSRPVQRCPAARGLPPSSRKRVLLKQSGSRTSCSFVHGVSIRWHLL